MPGNEEQYALACGEISAFLEAQAGVSTGQLAALSSGDYTTASNARDEVETLLNLAMADAFRQEGAGGEEGAGRNEPFYLYLRRCVRPDLGRAAPL